jgi:ADP-dependent NAD(P)H-hydrate dehydratase
MLNDPKLTTPLLQDLPSPPLPKLPPRPDDSHKGSFGHALLIGGSRGMSGAIALAGLAAMRTGAGLTTLAVPDRCLETVSASSPCLMTLPLADDGSGSIQFRAIDQLQPWLEKATCVGIGPGMGRSRDLQSLMHRILHVARCPLVIDADALNNLADSNWQPNTANASIVLTPHPGEWSRLSGIPASDRNGQCQSAVGFAARHELTIVLKGKHSLITDGKSAAFNTTGTPAMSIGGSGDVLTGIITGLICQGLPPRDAAHLAVHVHGLSGELAQQQAHSHVVLPTDLIDSLGMAFQQSSHGT